jgi:heme exporter protein A
VTTAWAPETGTARAIALEARDLGHDYGARRGLATIRFSVSGPGTVAVTGANGSGKSTLLRILAGLLRPSRGASVLTLEGAVLAPPQRRRDVGYAAPDLAFYEEFTVRENLAFAAEARGMAGREQAVRAALECVELATRSEDRVAALSSGMRQRLRLAFALLHRPAVLLLDEPGSHLDDSGRAVVERIIARQSAQGLVLIATNDERESKLAGERIELRGGGLGRPA